MFVFHANTVLVSCHCHCHSSLPISGKDIADLMLDFIDWLTNQEFGRRCILSVRDILSWVNFMNTVCERDEDGFMTMGELEEEEPEWDLRLDTVTAFIHAACLVYVDGIGSGERKKTSNCFFLSFMLWYLFTTIRSKMKYKGSFFSFF